MPILPVLALILSFIGPLLQGLMGATDPNAYIFAPVIFAGVIPLLARNGATPDPVKMAIGILVVGGLCMGLWWLGSKIAGEAPVAMPGWLPLTFAFGGVVLSVALNLLIARRADGA